MMHGKARFRMVLAANQESLPVRSLPEAKKNP